MKRLAVLLLFLFIPAAAVASPTDDEMRPAIAADADPVDTMGECMNSASPESPACQAASQDLVEWNRIRKKLISEFHAYCEEKYSPSPERDDCLRERLTPELPIPDDYPSKAANMVLRSRNPEYAKRMAVWIQRQKEAERQAWMERVREATQAKQRELEQQLRESDARLLDIDRRLAENQARQRQLDRDSMALQSLRLLHEGGFPSGSLPIPPPALINPIPSPYASPVTPSASGPFAITSQSIGGIRVFGGDVTGTSQSIGNRRLYFFDDGTSVTRNRIGSIDHYFGSVPGLSGYTNTVGGATFGTWEDGTTSTHQSVGGVIHHYFSNGPNCTTTRAGSTAYTFCN